MCESAAPSTTNQNATQGIYIKDIKWLGKSLQAYNIKMYYEHVFKSGRNVHVILAFLKVLLLLKVSRGRWLLVLLRRINVYSRSQRQTSPAYTHTCKQKQKLRNSTTIYKNSKQNWSRTILCITTIAWTQKPPKTELECENKS